MSNNVVSGLLWRMARRGDPTSPDAHPDQYARSFYSVAARGRLASVIAQAVDRRGWIDDYHLLDLVYRVARLLNTDRIAWDEFLPTMDAGVYTDLLVTRNVATFVPERYRALALFTGRLRRGLDRPVGVADWGCSRNLGLAYAQSPHVLSVGCEDWISRELDREPDRYADPTGFDALDLTPDEWSAWGRACGAYDTPPTPAPIGFDARRVVLDVCRPFSLESPDMPQFEVVYCSMMVHQLAPEQRRAMLANAARSLLPGGFLVELGFARPHCFGREWNTTTRVRVRTASGALGPSLTWLLWDSSRCRMARPGPDHTRINLALRSCKAA